MSQIDQRFADLNRDRLLIDIGGCELDVLVASDVDLDSRFAAVDAFTGERYLINGWLIDNVENLTA